ncbi:MAG TPA: NTP transferase domain-containing protein [Rhizomicrobium sp.]|nr:NTP transferase domain-containing protein [Rhizomicrobium sp.]
MIVDGIVLAAGASSRMGTHKPLLPFAGAKLIDAVIARTAPQVRRLAIDVPRAFAGDYRYPSVVPDLFDAQHGPVCGIVTGLEWLDGDMLATFPCDTPFLPHDLVAQLARHTAPVTVKGMPVCGLWPKAALGTLRNHVGQSVRGALAALGGREVEIAAGPHAFFNVNAPADLREAERLFAQADADCRGLPPGSGGASPGPRTS